MSEDMDNKDLAYVGNEGLHWLMGSMETLACQLEAQAKEIRRVKAELAKRWRSDYEKNHPAKKRGGEV